MPEKTYDELTCLMCSLAACDESDPDCAYQASRTVRTVALPKKVVSAAQERRREQYRRSKAKAQSRRQSVMQAVRELRDQGMVG